MQTIKKLATLLNVAGLLFASSVWADAKSDGVNTEENHFIFPAAGPGEGNSNVGVGGRVVLILPTFDFTYNHGISDALTFEVNAFSLGVFNSLETGLRFRLLGNESFSLAVRGDVRADARVDSASLAFLGPTSEEAVALGVTPGLIASFGGKRAQLSLGLDLPTNVVLVGGPGETTVTGAFLAFRPSITAEFSVSENTNLYLQGQGLVVDGAVVPIFAAGSAF